MKRLLFINMILAFTVSVKAQHTQSGTIEYERKTNLHRTIDQMDEDDRKWIDRMRSQIPKHIVHYFDLSFNTQHSLYKPGREPEKTVNLWFAQTPASENVVYTDFTTGRVTAQKQVYEEKFLVKDTMRKLEWKIMDEVRTIADFPCRKAVAVMCDSVYVIAFYTEDILANGGPEMFSGLPGMVLEVAVPRLHTTWIATKINFDPPAEKDIVPPKKGKEVTMADMHKTISTSLERWGKWGNRVVWWSVL